MKSKYDVVILGAGHNGLVAATYLGRAGLSVLLLEKNDYIGGATTSQKLFPDYEARLSRYSYLVSLFPEKIIRDLGLKLELRRRATASFTPYVKDGRQDGLLLSNVDEAVSRKSIVDLTGSETELVQLKKFYQLSRVFAELSWDSMLEPLRAQDEFKKRFEVDDVSREAWRSLAEEPLGGAIERYLQDDLVRGLVLTDAKVGVFTHPHDPSLVQNRCFLYHLIGNKTGEWRVPVGGMGAVAGELEQAARKAGAEMLTNVDLRQVDLTGEKRAIEFEVDGKKETVEARFLLVNFGRNVLARFSGRPYQPDRTDEGSVFKINMLLQRLPQLKAKKFPASEAFCGTFHSDEGYGQMNLSYAQAAKGRLPDKTPCEVYCHTLTDDSILSPELRQQGFHTMTLFGLDAPYSLFARNNGTMRAEAEKKFLASMNQWLEEPLEDCLAVARDGSLCIESKSPVDIEESLGMYHGNIFHDAPSWPFATRKEQTGRWGVETEFENVFLCGSSAQRGGAVSGIPGHNAARAVLDIIRKTPNAQHPMSKSEANPADVGSIDAIITAAYDGISGSAGQKRDWDRERSLHFPGARLIPTAMKAGGDDVDLTPHVLDIEGFIARVEPFFEKEGFYEKEIARRTEQFGNIAHVWSTYESRRDPSDPKPFMRGINSIQLFYDGKRWWILSIYWQQESPDAPIPEKYLRDN